MNHIECTELRNQIKPEARKMYISNIATAYIININSKPVIKTFSFQHFDDMGEEDQLLHTKMMKKVLSGKMGRQIMEYRFENDEEDGSSSRQKLFYQMNESRLSDEEAIRKFMESFANSVEYTTGYYLTLAAFEYSVPVIDKNDEENTEASGTKHRFFILAVNEISPADIGLCYDNEENSVSYKADHDLHVLPNPLDGMMFPVFTDRATDVNHVLYYTKDPKKPNDMFIENIIGAKSQMPHVQEKETFQNLIEEVAAEDLNLELYSHIYGNVRDLVKESEDDEMAVMGKEEMRDLLLNAGMPESRMNLFSAAYDNTVKDEPLKTINLMDTDKISVKAADVTVSIKPDAAYKVSTRMIDGGLYLCIAVDDGLVVNGMEIKK